MWNKRKTATSCLINPPALTQASNSTHITKMKHGAIPPLMRHPDSTLLQKNTIYAGAHLTTITHRTHPLRHFHSTPFDVDTLHTLCWAGNPALFTKNNRNTCLPGWWRVETLQIYPEMENGGSVSCHPASSM